jgi:hypothetical protein
MCTVRRSAQSEGKCTQGREVHKVRTNVHKEKKCTQRSTEALRDHPVYDDGFVLTYLLPVLLFLITSAIFLASQVFLFANFMSEDRCRQFLPVIICGNVYQNAYVMAYGSIGGVLLFLSGVMENAAKLGLVRTLGPRVSKVD